MSPRVIYIAGPISGTTDARERFAAAEAALVAAGYVTINPAAAFSHGMPWEWYMQRCRPLVEAADGVCLLEGWMESRGARIESLWGLSAGLDEGDLEFWLERAMGGGAA